MPSSIANSKVWLPLNWTLTGLQEHMNYYIRKKSILSFQDNSVTAQERLQDQYQEAALKQELFQELYRLSKLKIFARWRKVVEIQVDELKERLSLEAH